MIHSLQESIKIGVGMNKMYEYLKEHAYVSENKHSNYQFELTEERAECIANKHNNIIKDLEEANKQLKDNINQMDDSVDKLQKKLIKQKEVIDKAIELLNNPWSFESGNKEVYEQLKAINNEYERLNKENSRGFKITNVQEYNIYELLSFKNYKDNWNKLKEYCEENTLCYEVGDDENTKLIGSRIRGLNVLDKMQELEQGSDINEI